MKSATNRNLKMLNLSKRIIGRLFGYIFLGCLSLLLIFTRRAIFVVETLFGDLGNRLFLFAKAPIFNLSSVDAVIHRGGFRRIFNHPDTRDDSFPDDHDITNSILAEGSTK
jgi:hypothetical protein